MHDAQSDCLLHLRSEVNAGVVARQGAEGILMIESGVGGGREGRIASMVSSGTNTLRRRDQRAVRSKPTATKRASKTPTGIMMRVLTFILLFT